MGDALAVELAGLAAGLAVGGAGEEQRPAPGSGDRVRSRTGHHFLPDGQPLREEHVWSGRGTPSNLYDSVISLPYG